MRVRDFAPGAALAPFVRTFKVIEAAEDTTRVLIPDTGIVLGLRYSGSATLVGGSERSSNSDSNGDDDRGSRGGGGEAAAVRMPDATVTGLRDAARRMRTSAGAGAIFAMFREGGAAQFFDEPLHELFGRTVDLVDLSPAAPGGLGRHRARELAAIAQLHERLAAVGTGAAAQASALAEAHALAEAGPAAEAGAVVEANGAAEARAVAEAHAVASAAAAAADARRVAIVEGFLLTRYLQRQQHHQRYRREPHAWLDPLVAAAVRAIHAARGAIRIGALAAALGIGQDRLEKRFRRSVGSSPKHLASLIRLHRAIAAYRPGASLARVAAEAGYFDQSHFTREFRAVMGQPPQRFFTSAERC